MTGAKFKYCYICLRCTKHSWTGESAYDGKLVCTEHK